jgi:hypothetical protein
MSLALAKQIWLELSNGGLSPKAEFGCNPPDIARTFEEIEPTLA